MTLADDLAAAQDKRDRLRAEQVRRQMVKFGIMRRRCQNPKCGALLNKHTPIVCPECGEKVEVVK